MFSKAQLTNSSTKYLFILKNSLVFSHFYFKFSMVILNYFQLLNIFALLDIKFTVTFDGQPLFFISVLI